MSGRLGVDFGTCNTVVSVWDYIKNDSQTVRLKDYSETQTTKYGTVYTIPSLIHYLENGEYLYGEEVIQKNVLHSDRTFQWMKRNICRRSYMDRKIDGRIVTFFDAGEKFLSQVLKVAANHLSSIDDEIGLTLPVESFELYTNWLSSVANSAGFNRFRVIDEPSAAAIGYGSLLRPGDAHLVFDFGGGTLDVAVISVSPTVTTDGQFCKVLGKAGIDLGGADIDAWLFQEVLLRNGLTESDEAIRGMTRLLLSECESLKKSLSLEKKASLDVMNPITGALISVEFSQDELENLLDRNDMFAQIDKTIRRALKDAEKNGLAEEALKSIMMVGGSSLIPSVQKTIKRIFGNERVQIDRPLDAVARGAAAFIAGNVLQDYIQHDYAIRYVNPRTQSYEYRTIVKRGTKYPTQRLAKMLIKASYDGQDRLGIPIFEIGSDHSEIGSKERIEIFYDESGAARIKSVNEREFSRRQFFWLNENSPTFLTANPPGTQGEPRFNVEFSVDENRRLLLTAIDIKSSNVILREFPVVKLV